MVARPQAQQNVARCRDGANVFKVSKCMLRIWVLRGQTGPSLCMDRPSLFYGLSARWFALQRHTAPSLHLPLLLEEIFLHTLVSRLFTECKFQMGNSWSERLPNNSGNKGINMPRMHGRVCSTLWDVAGWAT